jgi:nifR3 family TIM-barrel protein
VRVGDIVLRNPWILAPMAGVSEMPFRRLAQELGAAAAPTELISAQGLLRGQARSDAYLRHGEDEVPFWVQLFGANPEALGVAAVRAVERGAQIVDLNMGCPVPKVTKNGAGSALLTDPDRAYLVVRSMVVRSGVPVTIKIRSGWDHAHISAGEMIEMAAAAGAAAVSIHARTRAQGYSGRADWGLIRDLVAKSPLPIIGNGDALTARAARALLAETGCAAVMIGRGALGNPWIFQELTGGAKPGHGAERWPTIERHFVAHLAHVGDELRAVRRFRSHLGWYSAGLAGASQFRRNAMVTEGAAAVRSMAQRYFEQAELVASDAPRTFRAQAALG